MDRNTRRLESLQERQTPTKFYPSFELDKFKGVRGSYKTFGTELNIGEHSYSICAIVLVLHKFLVPFKIINCTCDRAFVKPDRSFLLKIRFIFFTNAASESIKKESVTNMNFIEVLLFLDCENEFQHLLIRGRGNLFLQ